MALRIGVDATTWTNRRGYGRYTRGLLGAVVRLDPRNRYTFFVDDQRSAGELPAGVEIVVVDARAPTAVAASAAGRRGVADLYRMSRALADRRLDVLFFPSLYSYVPVASRARKIVSIPDVIAETFPDLALGTRAARALWACKAAAARRQADAVVTLSGYSRRHIVRRWRIDPSGIFVVGAAADAVFRRIPDPRPSERVRALAAEGRTVVFVGGFSPHKNVDRLIDAFGAVARTRPDARLVLVGELESEVFTSALAALRRQAEQIPDRERIVFAGRLDDEDLAVLLNLAAVLVLPSMMEGLGLPGLEAAACGCPVIATTESPLPELLGEGGLYVHPHDRFDLERCIARVLDGEELRRHMRAAGIAAARKSSWETAARTLIEVIESA